ncbi:MAG TPA: undecaprenyl-diphosphate phosphatase [Candidatus Kapabacteria bacterium]|nr:undecaprenyl-diphosphate phosphatase [Candidatus Kapabacteria bacterium]HOV92633.1 undecaprenyl-diphosphate phosphatase [Candidatus Kapabacteria bacterium]
MADILKAIILGIVEGFTEFLPISSTGHLILVNQFIGFPNEFEKTFDIVIQFGAILAIIVLYWNRLNPFIGDTAKKTQTFELWKKIIVALVPAILIGGTLGGIVEEKLFNPYVVATALLIGGIILLIIESTKRKTKFHSITQLSYTTALAIGFIQTLAMIPGTSRSAATIIGAMLLGCSRVISAEFSFFLAVPTMLAASVYSLYKHGMNLTGNEYLTLAVGFIVSFIVAYFVVAGFMKFISTKDFKVFGWYRIVLGIVVLLFFLL